MLFIPVSILLSLTAVRFDPGAVSMGAQEPTLVGSEASGQVVTEIDARIWKILQARNGDMWFGSNGNGVYRYDGEGLLHYTEADGLKGLQVRDLQEDGEGGILVATRVGVTRFDGKGMIPLEIVDRPAGEGWRLNPDDVWLVFDPGTGGPCRYDGETLFRLTFPPNPVPVGRGDEPESPRFPRSGLYSIHKDRRGHLWFGTAEAGLCRYDGKDIAWMYEAPLTTMGHGGEFGIRSIFEAQDGRFWICNTRQSFRMSPEVRTQGGFPRIQYTRSAGLPGSELETSPNFTYYPSMVEDAAGALWMACGGEGVWSFDGKQVTHYAIGDAGYALTICRDQQGKLWVGTLEQGVFTLEGTGFESFRAPEPALESDKD